MYKSIYLTGAPATGKSTLIKILSEENNKVKVFEYGKEMAKYLTQKNNLLVEQSKMKSGIETLVSDEDIATVNKKMKLFIDKNSNNNHTIVDAHQITKEKYGFKLRAFSLEQLKELRIDEIWVLYCSSEIIKERVLNNSAGRPMMDNFEIDFHSLTQANLAINYSLILNVPILFFNSGDSAMSYKKSMLSRLNADS